MTNWKAKLKLGDVFHSETMPFADRRDAIVARIRSAGWYKRAAADEDDGYEIQDIVDELAEAETADAFDDVWSEFYDYADRERIWVETVR